MVMVVLLRHIPVALVRALAGVLLPVHGVLLLLGLGLLHALCCRRRGQAPPAGWRRDSSTTATSGDAERPEHRASARASSRPKRVGVHEKRVSLRAVQRRVPRSALRRERRSFIRRSCHGADAFAPAGREGDTQGRAPGRLWTSGGAWPSAAAAHVECRRDAYTRGERTGRRGNEFGRQRRADRVTRDAWELFKSKPRLTEVRPRFALNGGMEPDLQGSTETPFRATF